MKYWQEREEADNQHRVMKPDTTNLRALQTIPWGKKHAYCVEGDTYAARVESNEDYMLETTIHFGG